MTTPTGFPPEITGLCKKRAAHLTKDEEGGDWWDKEDRDWKVFQAFYDRLPSSLRQANTAYTIEGRGAGVHATLSPIGSPSVSAMAGILEDAVEYYAHLHRGHFSDKSFSEYWKQVEAEFFNEDLEVLFVAPIAMLDTPGFPPKFLQYPGLEFRFLNGGSPRDVLISKAITEAIKSESRLLGNSALPDTDFPLVLTYKKVFQKDRFHGGVFYEASNLFQMTLLSMRLLKGGGCNFVMIKAFFLGNWCGPNLASAPYRLNRIHENAGSTHLMLNVEANWPETINKFLGLDYEGVRFIDTELRSSHNLPYRYPSEAMEQELEYIHLDELLDVIQAIEAALGLSGRHVPEYVSKLAAPVTGRKRTACKSAMDDAYDLRNAYAHGDYSKLNILLSGLRSQGRHKLRDLLNAVRQWCSRAIARVILTPGFPVKLAFHHLKLGRRLHDGHPYGRVARGPTRFPSAKNVNIYTP